MLVIPAIDLRGGKCVRLRQGDYSQETVFSDDPAGVAQQFLDAGAKFLHMVDLDGARVGHPVNTAAIESIAKRATYAGASSQLGGGLRTDVAIESALDLGITRAIVGTRAVKDPEWFATTARRLAGRLVLGLDARDGKVAVEGWNAGTAVDALDLIDQTRDLPLAALVYTDISRDGMMAGPNFDATAAVAARAPWQVVASGGVTSEEDVVELQRRGIGACILGRSLYEGSINLPALLRRLGNRC
jgi:phosphoribosylformimino-5-aminoimidazole carboxamide ribotide isomerase